MPRSPLFRSLLQPVKDLVDRATFRPVREKVDIRSNILEHHIAESRTHLTGALESTVSHVEGQLDVLHEGLGDQLAVLGARVTSVEAETWAIREVTQDALAEIRSVRARMGAIPGSRLGARLSEIDEGTADFLNYAASHEGPRRDAGAWINEPVWFRWSPGSIEVSSVNERIVEQPFVLRSLAGLPAGARILDVGGGESTLGLQLASMGYRTTVMEPRGYPFEHPNLEVTTEPIETFTADEPFDAVILLSTIEHFGIGHYGDHVDDDADLAAMDRIRDLVGGTGLVILTTPYGPFEVTPVERIYDRSHLQRLLAGWDVLTTHIASRRDERTWVIEADELVEPAKPGSVALVTARPRPSDGPATA